MHDYFNIPKELLVRITVKRITLFKHDIDSKKEKRSELVFATFNYNIDVILWK